MSNFFVQAHADVTSDFEILSAPIQSILNNVWSTPTKLPNDKDFCSLEKFCSVLKPKVDDFYIYENAAHEKFPNTMVLKQMLESQVCFKKKIQDEDSAINLAKLQYECERDKSLTDLEKKELCNLRILKSSHTSVVHNTREDKRRRLNDLSLENDSYQLIYKAKELLSLVKNNGEDSKNLASTLEDFLIYVQLFLETKTGLDGKYLSLMGMNHLEEFFFRDFNVSDFSEENKPKIIEFLDYLRELCLKSLNKDQESYVFYSGSYELKRAKKKLKFTVRSPLLYQLKNSKLDSFEEVKLEIRAFVTAQKKIAQLIEKSKVGIIEQLKNRVHSNSVSQSDKDSFEFMMKRIETVRMSSAVNKNVCKIENSPAHYEPNGHIIHICPWLFELPEMTITQILVHELTHAIDPCSISYPLEIKNGRFSLYTQTKKSVSKLEKENSQIVGKPISFEANPFAKTLQCLQDPKSIGAIVRTPESHLNVLKKQLSEQTMVGFNVSSDSEVTEVTDLLNDFSEQMKVHKGCNKLPALGSQLSEAFADWMAAKVIAAEISKENNPELKKSKAYESSLFFLNYVEACGHPQNSQLATIQKTQKLLGCHNLPPQYWIDEPKNSPLPEHSPVVNEIDSDYIASHPPVQKRITHILLQEPEIRKALGCTVSSIPEFYCE